MTCKSEQQSCSGKLKQEDGLKLEVWIRELKCQVIIFPKFEKWLGFIAAN